MFLFLTMMFVGMKRFMLLWNQAQICLAQLNFKAIFIFFDESVFILQKKALYYV